MIGDRATIDKVGQLERENYVMSGLLNDKEKEIVEKLKKLQDMQNECDTCIRQDCEIARLEKERDNYKKGWEECVLLGYEGDAKIIKLEKENKTLKVELVIERVESARHKSLAEAHHRLEKRHEERLANMEKKYKAENEAIKFLNREEVEKICYNDFFQRDIDGMVTAICNLALPVIDKEKLVKVLHHWFYDTASVCNCEDVIEGMKHLADEIITAIKEIEND